MKHIQEEYQKFMEKVRGKAQSAIDLANTMFQANRTELTTQVDVLVHLMHNRFYYQVPPITLLMAHSALVMGLRYFPSAACLLQRGGR